ncbi:MAG TPA: TetR family transcriptional regulator [Actinospica sp.]|nr:TetR family transcriptional regulator [Actinospica sp.]
MTMAAEPSSREPLTREQILVAAKRVLRRHGPAKATVVDVAQALGVSHGSVYRHFPTKAALRAAVIGEGLAELDRVLASTTEESGSAVERLHRWLLALIDFKQRFAREDPELFETYCLIEVDKPKAVSAHVELSIGMIDRILADGVAAGEIGPSAQKAGGRAIWDATARFHHPLHHAEWADPEINADFKRVWRLLRDGLTA